MHFEVDYWYKESKPKKLEDAKYLYHYKYLYSKIVVLQKYYDGAFISSFSTPKETKKYELSDKNSLNQRIDFYKNDKFSALCEIGDHLLEISQKITIIDNLMIFSQNMNQNQNMFLHLSPKK